MREANTPLFPDKLGSTIDFIDLTSIDIPFDFNRALPMTDSAPQDSAPKHTNQLVHETSPYLLQHAHNPVDWHPWGEPALEKARTQDKPIFLSIGYSACHWCHVMEHESFEEEDIAELMNQHFINIKVDREERPDLDQIYMQAVIALTGQGGWPMSVFLTPKGQPFYGGTYWPPIPKFGRPGFPQILEAIHDAWQNKRDQLDEQANRLTAALQDEALTEGQTSPLSETMITNAKSLLLRHADSANGGFGRAPKFPHPFDVRVLLRSHKRLGDQASLEHAVLTLEKMARGGIYDHLGGGFHRYSTDPVWLVPHFEKMLYDNALLVPAYLEAYQITKREDFANTVRETLDYVLREMTQPQGGFYATQDADSEGVEGKFFVWTAEEIASHLGEDRARIFNACYDVSPNGNWEGHTILNLPRSLEESAELLAMDHAELADILAECRAELFSFRSQRIAPGRDDKVLTSWNGLMMTAMAMAAQILGEPRYAKAAQDAADFVLNSLRTPEGGLLHSFKDDQARFNAYLDDYACFLDGLAEVYQATFEAKYLTSAAELAEEMNSRFGDTDQGGFYYTASDHETLIVRQKDSQDNATPSGNAMAATALLKLSRLCGNPAWETVAVKTLESLSAQIEKAPSASGQALIALDFLLGETWEVVVVDGTDPYQSAEMFVELHQAFLPNKVVLRRPKELEDADLPSELKPMLSGKTAHDGKATLYLCKQGTCQNPITEIESFKAWLDS